MPIGKIVNYEKHSFQLEKSPSSSIDTNDRSISKVYSSKAAEAFSSPTPVDVAQEAQKGVELRERSKVHPFEDVEDIFQTTNTCLRRGESVIDVEVKLAKEKEKEWRKSKGMEEKGGEEDDDDALHKIIVYLEGYLEDEEETGLKKLPHYKEEAIKRLAERRLKNEFLQNKRREIDLLNEGKIKCLSKDIDLDAIEHQTYKSEYSKEELQGVSLATLKELYSGNAMKPIQCSAKDEEELKSYKIELSRRYFLELEHLVKQRKVEELNAKKKESERNDRATKKLESTRDLNETPNAVDQNKHEKHVHATNGFSVQTNDSKSGKNVAKKNDEIIRRNSHEANTGFYATKDITFVNASRAEEQRVEQKRALGPGKFARVIRHGDTENMIAEEIAVAKHRETELQRLRSLLLDSFTPQKPS